MKFGQYLQDTQTPEWKRAYIDYKGLKKKIKAVQASQNPDDGQSHSAPASQSTPKPTLKASASTPVISTRPPTLKQVPSRSPGYGSLGRTPPLDPDSGKSPSGFFLPPPAQELPESATRASIEPDNDDSIGRTTGVERTKSNFQPSQSGAHGSPISTRIFTTFRRRVTGSPSLRSSRKEPENVEVLMASLRPLEREYFDYLNHELEKVEKFYIEREKEAKIQWSVLQEQLRELQDHRRLFHETRVETRLTRVATKAMESIGVSRHLREHVLHIKSKGKGKLQEIGEELEPGSPRSSIVGGGHEDLDPDEYQHAKKKLKQALREFYRGLELLKNYRILNLSGFRKALKKFEKRTQMPVQKLYMHEVIEKQTFASETVVETMLKEVEEAYASRFENGDFKKARDRLRVAYRIRSHHASTFRTGLFLGVALPAFVSAIYHSFQPETREAIPEWTALIQIYAILLLPCIFAVLVGINLHVWRKSRINWVFIFELDVRTAIDTRQYLELPSFLLSTLVYAFWLSFSPTGRISVAPRWWPVIWLGFVAVVMGNPLPILYRESRWWLLKNVAKLFVSGMQRVEFTDFWMGDQFCSMAYVLSNLYFMSCAYITHFRDPWVTCSAGGVHWAIPCTLSAVPSLIRLVQSIKRYYDSKLITHLINAGKYLSSIVFYIAYYHWRHRGIVYDWSFGLMVIFGTIMSTYTSAWDLTMDWSVLQTNAPYPFLRKDILYTHWIPAYYFAIVSNVCIRFIWIIYTPRQGLSTPLRTFIGGSLELLRRVQWNFFRLENEHIGNTDQYRVTREVPLPYSFDEDGESIAGDDEDARPSVKLARVETRMDVKSDEA